MSDIVYIKTISELHEIMSYEKPKHPLITVIDFSKVKPIQLEESVKVVSSFYSVMMKGAACGHMRYGRETYDYQEGTLFCMAPDQVITKDSSEVDDGEEYSGWGLFFHPDLIRKSPLAKKIHDYTFFSYEVNEALHLSDQEKTNLFELLNRIQDEYSINLDNYSNDLILSSLELFLNYCNRYYGRQFITRSSHNKDVLSQLESLLKDYFNTDKAELSGIPTVKYCAEQLHFSPNYLSDLIKKESGRSVQEHIHYRLIEKAKTKLLSTTNSVSEIATQLGFEYPQYFSKIFKSKTGVSPVEYRNMN
ncbi:helix-turn-helix domain-containing protein [Marinifilum caeruleilacunae]|uniref:AraC family transcriptional regulator n=1 Tax=Marinifilum caeruleilacunae TaxID=2499076 RepID=A0ABX1WV58_9BACT|nr:response regulator transcription factor [Marinifilum caeruleilacunae]NOU59996.1 AraC family transcriptional regulator [Marinifilum caeruleilacunae]